MIILHLYKCKDKKGYINMAMIKCPECGKMVSDRASVCPGCGYPISSLASNGIVQVKLGMFQSTQNATIYSNGRALWSGKTGQIAELKITSPTKSTDKVPNGYV